MIIYIIFIFSAICCISCTFGSTYFIKMSQKRERTYDSALVKIFCFLLFVSFVVLCLAVAVIFEEIYPGMFSVVQK